MTGNNYATKINSMAKMTAAAEATMASDPAIVSVVFASPWEEGAWVTIMRDGMAWDSDSEGNRLRR